MSRKETIILSPGTQVEWVSQSQGVETRKEGVVLEFIEAYWFPKFDFSYIKTSHLKFKPHLASISDRYLVAVQRDGKTFYYAPRASAVKKISLAVT